ncbi:MAG: xanthine dehydrogenase [Actinobacteria bacterium]|nr:MAG: xanthine dehydrogenase [Actinomycetota bacterium]
MSDVIGAIHRLRDEEILGSVVTMVSGPDVGDKAVIESGAGIVAGAIPEEIAAAVVADAAELARHEQSRTLEYGSRRVFIETLAPSPVLLIFGAGHIAQPLTRMARELGFRTIVADARAAWATPERFPDVDQLIVGWPDAVFERISLDHRTYVALLSHDARFEDPVLPAVRNAPVRYIGAMGSRRTHRDRRERLAAAGWSEEELARIHGPIGIDIGAETPAETAVSILAEIIRVRYGHGSGVPLRGTEGRIHAQRGDEPGTS